MNANVAQHNANTKTKFEIDAVSRPTEQLYQLYY